MDDDAGCGTESEEEDGAASSAAPESRCSVVACIAEVSTHATCSWQGLLNLDLMKGSPARASGRQLKRQTHVICWGSPVLGLLAGGPEEVQRML